MQGKKPYEIFRRGVRLIPQGRHIFPMLTVEENLKLALVQAGIRDEKAELEKAYAMFPVLKEKSRDRARNLSGGQLQMVANARALLGPARLILMDEPTEGLAPIIIEQIGKSILEMKQSGKTVLLAEQHLQDGPGRRRPSLHHRQRPPGFSGTSAEIQANEEIKATYFGVSKERIRLKKKGARDELEDSRFVPRRHHGSQGHGDDGPGYESGVSLPRILLSSWNPALGKFWWIRGFTPVLLSTAKPGPGRRPREERPFSWRPLKKHRPARKRSKRFSIRICTMITPATAISFPGPFMSSITTNGTNCINPLPSMRIRQDFDPAVIPILEKFRCRKVVGDGEFTDGNPLLSHSRPHHRRADFRCGYDRRAPMLFPGIS